MRARAARFIASTSVALLLLGASASQAGPGGEPGPPGGVPPGQIISGHLSIVHADDFEGDTRHEHDESVPGHVLPGLQYWLTTDAGEELLLEFPGHPPEATTDGYYEVRGERHGKAVHVAEMRESAAPGGGKGGGGSKPPKGSTPSFVGPRDMIVIPISFKADPTKVLTPQRAEMRQNGFGTGRTVRAFYEESSASTNPSNPVVLKGKNDGTAADKDGDVGDVTATYAIDGSTTICDYRTWAANAKAAASADGWDLTGYEHIVYIHPLLLKNDGTGVCSYSGLAEIGGDESWLHDNVHVGVWSHELGHNLTLYHSRTLICSDGEVFFSVARSGCTYEEYGDPFDTMGWTTTLAHRQYHGRNKAHMSWFPTANVVTGVSGGEYTLYPLETAPLGPQLLQITRGRSENLYVDFRQPAGQFDNYASTSDAVTGAMIRVGPSIPTNGNSWLIDTAMFPLFTDTNESPPATEPDFRDAALQVGQGWVDISGVYIEVLSRDAVAGTITVRVLTGQTNLAPNVTVAAGGPLILPGVPHQVPGATASDTHKNLGMYRWAWESCPTTCPTLTGVTEGALSGGEDSIEGPIYVPTVPGDYTLSLTVWDTSGANTVTQVTETVGV